MTILLLFLSLVMLYLIGYMFLGILFPDYFKKKHDLSLTFSIAMGLGFGLTSWLHFLELLFFNRNLNYMVDSLLLLVLLIYRYLVTRKEVNGDTRSRFVLPLKTNRFIVAIFSTCLTIAILRYLFTVLQKPYGDWGDWDAWAIWNLRARFIFRGEGQWRDAFSVLMDWSHPDYPLLLPLSIVRSWNYIGKESELVPMAISAFFTFSTAALIYSSLALLRNKMQGVLAACVLLSVPFFLSHGSSQTADVPLGFYFLLSIVLLSLHDKLYFGSFRIMLLAGMAAAFSAWTKNEGLLFILSLVIVQLVVALIRKEVKLFYRTMIPFISGAAPVLLAIIYFKCYLAPSNDLVNSEGFIVSMRKLADFHRYVQIGESIKSAIDLWWIYSALFLILYLSIIKIRLRIKEKRTIYIIALTLFLMVIGYIIAYVITPYDIAWHISVSVNRLILQLWPSFVFLCFMIASPIGSEYVEQD